MKNNEVQQKQPNQKRFFLIFGIIIILAGVAFFTKQFINKPSIQTETLVVKPVSTTILANGSIASQNEATLHFQIPGQIVYLPFKEGDTVQQGQVIAQLDQRTIQQNIESATKAYQNQKIQFDIVNDNNGDRLLNDLSLSTSALRQLTTAVNTLDQAQVAVTIQKIAQEQSTLVSPINGIITHEDVTTPLVNITPTTSFSVANPTQLVFKANVSETDINFIQVNAPAKVTLAGDATEYTGTVVKIYPDKKILPSGEAVYQVDIQSDALKANGKYKQAGAALIQNKFNQSVILVPSWTVLQNQYVWVVENNKPVMKKVTVGTTVNNNLEILDGLSSGDKIITNPEAIIAHKYILL